MKVGDGDGRAPADRLDALLRVVQGPSRLIGRRRDYLARRRPSQPRDDEPVPVPERDSLEDASRFGRTVSIKGEVTASEHLIIEGRVDGKLTAPEHGVAIGRDATVMADIVARTVTVLGQATGSFLASELVETRPSGSVEGPIASPAVAIDEGAYFKGFIDPKRAQPPGTDSVKRSPEQARSARSSRP